jgi:acetyl esterase/lipase
MSASQFAPNNSKTALFKYILPHVPYLLLRSSAHLLGFSDSSQYWDLKAAVTVSFLRSVLATPRNPPETIERVQWIANKPTAVGADTWCVPVTYNPSADFSGEALIRAAIVALGGEEASILPAPPAELTGEWVSSRSTPDTAAATPATYPALLADTPEKDIVVLYLHGGAYCLGDPHSHRHAVVRLCRTAKCRAFVPRYRLAPQSPFPGPVLDALVSYLFLLYPPPGSLHTATPADKIVFAGDSAGGGLVLALLLLLQEFQRKGVRICWYGQEVTAPPPAGVACSSAWCETARSFGTLASFPAGSEDTCQTYDILPSSDADHFYLESPAWNKQLRKERGMTQLYAPDALMAHPLVSPLLSDKWEKDTKVYLSTGDECLRDSNLYLAHRLREAGADVRLEWYAGMPHVFPALLGHLEVARLAWEGMGAFVRHVTGVEVKEGDELWGAWKWHPKTLRKEIVPEESLKCHGLEFEQVKEMVRTAIVRYRELALAKEKEREEAGVVMAKI